MTQWAAFSGIVVVVLALLLALARLSQAPSDDTASSDSDTASSDSDDTASTPDPPARYAGDDGDTWGERSATGTRGDPNGEARSMSAGALLVNVALSQGLFGVLLLGGAWYTRIPLTALGVSETPSSTGIPALVVGLGVGLGLALVNELGSRGASAVGIDTPEAFRASLAPDSTAGWFVLLAGALPIIALFEELLFRAALVGALSAGFGVSPWLLAVISSIAFALGHGAQGSLGMAVTGGFGFVLAGAFVLTGSLLVVVLAHYLVNTLEFAIHEFDGATAG